MTSSKPINASEGGSSPFIIFLDIDGVFNCELWYRKHHSEAKKQLKKDVKSKRIERLEYYKAQICPERIKWFNELCYETNSKVVISSTWRLGKTVQELQEILYYCGATFDIIGKTDHTGYERGTEIAKWLRENVLPETYGCNYYDFYRYAIIDDDSDMLLSQKEHFFQTDAYCGLTPTICYKIKRFITHRAF